MKKLFLFLFSLSLAATAPEELVGHLYASVRNNKIDEVLGLLEIQDPEQGYDSEYRSLINLRETPEGPTILEEACKTDNLDMVQFLFDHGADAAGAATVAAENGNARVLNFLMKQSVFAASKINDNPIAGKRKREEHEAPSEDESGDDERKLSEINGENFDALCAAASAGKTEIVRILLQEFQVNTDFKDIDGNTPLMLAARNNHLNAVKTLVIFGANKRLKNEGKTAKMMATELAHEEIVNYLGS